MHFPDLDPVAFSWGPLVLRWYALAYMAGILLGWQYIVRLGRRDDLWQDTAPYSEIHVDDFVLWATVSIIIGGRLGYVLFYNPSYYLAYPAAIPAVWEGGMSFHGGLAGVLVASLLFTRRHTLPLLSWADVVAAAAPIGLFFGRISNFINAELWGRPTSLPWGIIFPNGGPEPRHPSQLYEAGLEGLVLFAVIAFGIYRLHLLKTPGRVASLFLMGYGIARFMVEWVREPDEQLGFIMGTLTMGQVLSLPLILLGIVIFWISRQNASATQ